MNPTIGSPGTGVQQQEVMKAVVHALNENALHRLGLLHCGARRLVDPFKLAFLALRLRAQAARAISSLKRLTARYEMIPP